jgi:uncharacterized protein YbjT (DUF2867 family)
MDVLVAGATGRLGGPLADRLIDRGHRVRALTRNPGTGAAERLRRRGADVMAGDLDDPPSLRRAAAGADAVFVLSTPHHGTGPDGETRQAIALADAAVATGAGYLVYASAAGAGQARGVPMLDSKRRVEEYLATLPVPHAVIAPAYFMDNLAYPWNMAVLWFGHWPIPLPPERPVQLIPASDAARFAALVIERPGEFAGRRLELASDEVTGPQAARILSAVLHRPITHSQKILGPLVPMAPFFRWIAEVGFHADIERLRASYPEIGWRSLRQWSAARDWPGLAASAGPVAATGRCGA